MRNLEWSPNSPTSSSLIEGVHNSMQGIKRVNGCNLLDGYSISSPLLSQVDILYSSSMSFHSSSTLLPQLDQFHSKTLNGLRRLPMSQKARSIVPNVRATLSMDKNVEERTATKKGAIKNDVLAKEKGYGKANVRDGRNGSVLVGEKGDTKASRSTQSKVAKTLQNPTPTQSKDAETRQTPLREEVGQTPLREGEEVEQQKKLYTFNKVAKVAPTLQGGRRQDESEKEFSKVPRGDQTLPIVQSAKVTNIQDLITQNQDPNSLASTMLNIADNFISVFLSPPTLNPSMDPAIQLAGACTPVGETPPTPCPVIRGTIPADLNGAYIRNGPNATHLHEGDGFHLFDGDGMLHSVLIQDGAATFCARYVKTNRFRQEAAAGRALFPKYFGGMYGPSGFARLAVTALRTGLGLLDIAAGGGLSNTSVGFFDGKILSLSEDDMPYVIRVSDDGDLETVGKYELPWKLNMCAHPKFDYLTGEMYAFSFQPSPYVTPFTFFRVSADGVKSPDIPVPVGDLPLVHDFAITRNFVVFPENQLVLRPTGLLTGQMPVTCDTNKVARFCVLPRYGLPEDAIAKAQWFDAPGLNCLHYLTAWEDDNDVVVIAPVLSPAESILEIPAVNTYNTLSEIRLNRESGEVRCRNLCSGNFDFGTVNPKFIGGKKTRYGYLASGHFPDLNGIAKVDFEQAAIVGERQFDEGCHCSEPFFVPKDGDDVEEDDGYIVCYATDETSGVSEFLVMDAKSPSLEIIAAVELPSRVPVGFHGYFITREQLASQR